MTDHIIDVGKSSTDAHSPAVAANVKIPAVDVALAETLSAVPETAIEAEQLVPTGERLMPFLWAFDRRCERFEAAAATDPTVDRLTRHSELDDGNLYRVDWNLPRCPVLEWVANESVAITRAAADAQKGTWHIEFRFRSRSGLDGFQRFCAERDIEFVLTRLSEISGVKQEQTDLTDKQREAILTALDLGYFEIPRETSLDAVADQLNISVGAASERLRRGQRTLFDGVLRVDGPLRRGPPTVE